MGLWLIRFFDNRVVGAKGYVPRFDMFLNKTKKEYGIELSEEDMTKFNDMVISRKDSSGRGNSKSDGWSSRSYRKGNSETQARNTATVSRIEGADAQEVVRFNWIKQGLDSDTFTYSYYSQYSMLPYTRFNIM